LARAAGNVYLLPIGGDKGYGLSLIVGLLAGTLNSAAMGREVIDFNLDFESTTNTRRPTSRPSWVVSSRGSLTVA